MEKPLKFVRLVRGSAVMSLLSLLLPFQLSFAEAEVPWDEIHKLQRESIEPASSLGSIFMALIDGAIAHYADGEIEEGLAMAEKALSTHSRGHFITFVVDVKPRCLNLLRNATGSSNRARKRRLLR